MSADPQAEKQGGHEGGPAQQRRRRGTSLSEGLGADLNALGTILADHTRGLDAYLQRQGQRLEQRQQTLLAESAELLLTGGLDLEAMSIRELQSLCREKRLRGWSKLRRDDLLAFLQRELPSNGGDSAAAGPEATAARGGTDSPAIDRILVGAEASRTERLLLLALRHLGVPSEEVEAAWIGQASCERRPKAERRRGRTR